MKSYFQTYFILNSFYDSKKHTLFVKKYQIFIWLLVMSQRFELEISKETNGNQATGNPSLLGPGFRDVCWRFCRTILLGISKFKKNIK